MERSKSDLQLNGNLVFDSKELKEKNRDNSSIYTHYLGDFLDYGVSR